MSRKDRIKRLEAENSVLRIELRTARRVRDHFKMETEQVVERAVRSRDSNPLLPRVTFLRRLGRRAAPWAMSLGFSGWFFARYEIWFCEGRHMRSYWPDSELFKLTLPEALRFARRVGPAEGQHLELVDLGSGKHHDLRDPL